MPRLILEANIQHLDHHLASLVAAREQRACLGQPSVAVSSGTRDRFYLLSLFRPAPKSLRPTAAQVGVIGDLNRAVSSALAQAALLLRLKLPGDAPKQILLVRGPGLFVKNLPILFLQRRYCKTGATGICVCMAIRKERFLARAGFSMEG